MCRVSLPASRHENGLNGLDENKQVERRGHVLDVEEVILELFQRVFDAGPIRVTDLRPAGNAGLDNVTLAVKADLASQFRDEFRPFRTWPDKTHIATQDVPQLRQFVEARASKQRTYRSHPLVAHFRPNCSSMALGVHTHRSEFVDDEDLSVLPHAPLMIENRTLR